MQTPWKSVQCTSPEKHGKLCTSPNHPKAFDFEGYCHDMQHQCTSWNFTPPHMATKRPQKSSSPETTFLKHVAPRLPSKNFPTASLRSAQCSPWHNWFLGHVHARCMVVADTTMHLACTSVSSSFLDPQRPAKSPQKYRKTTKKSLTRSAPNASSFQRHSDTKTIRVSDFSAVHPSIKIRNPAQTTPRIKKGHHHRVSFLSMYPPDLRLPQRIDS